MKTTTKPKTTPRPPHMAIQCIIFSSPVSSHVQVKRQSLTTDQRSPQSNLNNNNTKRKHHVERLMYMLHVGTHATIHVKLHVAEHVRIHVKHVQLHCMACGNTCYVHVSMHAWQPEAQTNDELLALNASILQHIHTLQNKARGPQHSWSCQIPGEYALLRCAPVNFLRHCEHILEPTFVQPARGKTWIPSRHTVFQQMREQVKLRPHVPQPIHTEALVRHM